MDIVSLNNSDNLSDSSDSAFSEITSSTSNASISTQIENSHPKIYQWRDCYSAWQQFNEFRKLNIFCDIELIVDDVRFKAHRAVLSACSEYFKALFTGGWHTSMEPSIILDGVKPEIMKIIIDWAYTRKAQVTVDNVQELLPTADRFCAHAIVKNCVELLQVELCPENCLGIRQFAEHYFQHGLFEAAESFTLRNFEEITRSNEFLEIEPQVLYEFLASDELNVRSEEIAFQALVTWVNFKIESRCTIFSQILRTIRMGLMDPDYFMSKVKTHELIANQPGMRPIIKDAMRALYDLSTNSRTALTGSRISNPYIRPRFPHQILFAIGGWSGGSPTNAVETYDCRSETWTNITATECFTNERPRAYHGIVCDHKYIYMVGGFDGQNYFNSMRKIDLIRQRQTEEPPMKFRRCYVSCTIASHKIYALGGMDGQQRLNNAERYDILHHAWEELPVMTERRSDASSCSLHGKVYVAGGFNGHECLNSLEFYDESTSQWTRVTPMRSRRSGVSLITLNARIFAVGGFDGVNRLRTAECYNSDTNSWTQVANMINPRSNFGIEVLDQQIIAIGGFNGFQTTFNVEAYDDDTDEWYEIQDMSIFRSALACCVVSELPMEDMKRYAAPREENSSSTRAVPHYTASVNMVTE